MSDGLKVKNHKLTEKISEVSLRTVRGWLGFPLYERVIMIANNNVLKSAI